MEVSSSSVVESNLLAFFSGVSHQEKQYIKDSMRWAEYQANLRHDRQRRPVDWFEFYSGTLWSVGWELEGAPVIVVENNFSGNVLDIWAKSMSTLLSRGKISQMRETFKLLETHPEGLDLLTQSTRKLGDFSFSPAFYNSSQELEMVISNVRMLSNNWGSRYLFWEVDHSMSKLDIQSRRLVVTSKKMDQHRSGLSDAVKEMRRKEIELMR
ncbi:MULTISPECIES: hypothetical protein [unclassified Pseudomonas]|uniref:hypothetical protein n=1 Tax=unclassified Pseudomonas TaxID=196821 RepID=UPI000A1F3BCE|nr:MULTISPECIES: hypothetical protein [unclassified Pseudomonas]MDI2142867.1 hypothetical protein [Pseudomonas sp. ITA]